MKKKLVLSLSLVLVLAFAGCNKTEAPASSESAVESVVESAAESVEESTEEAGDAESAEEVDDVEEDVDDADVDVDAEEDAEVAVMSYADYIAADVDTKVCVETYVQAKQSWWDNKATVYTQNEDGGIFLYNMACSEEDYEKLVAGTKIKVTGYKAEWSGEIEIADATFEIEDGNFVAEAKDVTDLLGKDELVDSQNQFVAFKGLTVEAAGKDADGNDVAFLYNYDGSGEEGNDLYFNVSKDGQTYTFTVESYLCDSTTDVYKAVKELKIGDTVDMEGFLYWYEGVNPHITAVTVK